MIKHDANKKYIRQKFTKRIIIKKNLNSFPAKNFRRSGRCTFQSAIRKVKSPITLTLTPKVAKGLSGIGRAYIAVRIVPHWPSLTRCRLGLWVEVTAVSPAVGIDTAPKSSLPEPKSFPHRAARAPIRRGGRGVGAASMNAQNVLPAAQSHMALSLLVPARPAVLPSCRDLLINCLCS